MLRKLASALPATLLLVACGGGPDINQIKADFENPSGSVKNKDGMTAASSSLDASGSAVVVGGGGVPGQSLTAEGKVVGFWQINARRTWEARATSLRNYLGGRSTQIQALSEAQVDGGGGCENSPEAQAAFEDLLNDIAVDAANPFGNSSKVSGSASYEQDFSACSGGELSGSAKITIEIEAEQSGETARFAFKITYGLNQVCELSTAEKACLDGTMIIEAEGSSSTSDKLVFTTGWELDASWTENGVARTASLKGGIRSFFEATDTTGTAKIEVINYVTTPEGEEWSYVWSFEGSFNGLEGTATVECRGSDGSVSCTIDDQGGKCTASDGSSVEWTTADEESLDDAWLGG